MDIRNANIDNWFNSSRSYTKLLSEIAHPADKIQFFASERSKGKKVST